MRFKTYDEAIDWLFTQIPAFHRIGAGAYKPGLERTLRLAGMFGNPHLGIKAVHIAGTNGKGSVASLLASVAQASRLRTGLFTSPHLVDFRERIRINGEMISQCEVLDFLERFAQLNESEQIEPSFFELTTIMALDHFRRHNVDFAVIETGLGGRLDSTNIITPLLSVVTNISLDHTSLLGNTREAIAGEKAGIIKPGVAAVIGENDPEIADVFASVAARCGSKLTDASATCEIESWREEGECNIYETRSHGILRSPLTGECQARNAATVLAAVDNLRQNGINIPGEAVAEGFAEVCRFTGLTGRWTIVGREPLTIIDTGHNPGGWRYTTRHLLSTPGMRHLVIGFASDKDVDSILEMIAELPQERVALYFTSPAVERRLSAEDLASRAARFGLGGAMLNSVADAVEAAVKAATAADTVFIGGSNFVVAEALEAFAAKKKD